ncbi:hypothetical protein FHG87_011844 [Trinorchestia longiramus]|nr:hypothetical protein FHG87_011844 [Trinorchestia longiramus]
MKHKRSGHSGLRPGSTRRSTNGHTLYNLTDREAVSSGALLGARPGLPATQLSDEIFEKVPVARHDNLGGERSMFCLLAKRAASITLISDAQETDRHSDSIPAPRWRGEEDGLTLQSHSDLRLLYDFQSINDLLFHSDFWTHSNLRSLYDLFSTQISNFSTIFSPSAIFSHTPIFKPTLFSSALRSPASHQHGIKNVNRRPRRGELSGWARWLCSFKCELSFRRQVCL